MKSELLCFPLGGKGCVTSAHPVLVIRVEWLVVVLQAHRTQSSILSSANNCYLCCCIYPELVSHMLPHMAQLHHTRAERPLKTGDLSFPVGLSQDIISKQKLLVNVVLCYIRYLKVWPLDPSANEQPRALSGH